MLVLKIEKKENLKNKILANIKNLIVSVYYYRCALNLNIFWSFFLKALFIKNVEYSVNCCNLFLAMPWASESLNNLSSENCNFYWI